MHLQRHEGGGWVSLSANKAEAGEMITELIGLNRAQFTQVMLLPQGQFAKFLQAADDERRVLLSRLFGTQLYDAITAELDRRRAAAIRQAARPRKPSHRGCRPPPRLRALDAPGRAARSWLCPAPVRHPARQVAADLALEAAGDRGAGDRRRRRSRRARDACERARRGPAGG